MTLGELSGDEELNQIHLSLIFLPLWPRCCRIDPSPDHWKQDLHALQKNRVSLHTESLRDSGIAGCS